VLPETDDDKAIRIRDEFGQGIHQLLSPAVTVLAEYQCTELPARNIRRWPNYRRWRDQFKNPKIAVRALDGGPSRRSSNTNQGGA